MSSNIFKWKVNEANHEYVLTLFCLSNHVHRLKKLILKEQYIRSSDFANLYSDITNWYHYNRINDDIFLNHTFDEDDFAIIRQFKESILPEKRLATDNNYMLTRNIYEIS